MSTRIGVVALLVSTVALGAGILALTREPDQAPRRAPVRTDRVARLERRIDELTRAVASLQRAPAERWSPVPTRAPSSGEDASGSAAPATGIGADTRAADPELAEIVDEAVDRSTRRALDELRVKANRKPPIEAFASVLELTPDQLRATERIIVDGQHRVHEILEMPTAGGTSLMDELVEIAALGIAQPGEDHGFGAWVGRLFSEKIPGTSETYGARIEAVKAGMRDSFAHEWTPEQYDEFVQWGVDPTEVQNVTDSPNTRLWERVMERARELGAERSAAD